MTSQVLRAFRVRPECAYCGVALSCSEYGSNYATIDHIAPRSRGGADILSNKTLACLHCNRCKANATDWPAPTFTLADILPRPEPSCEEEFDYDEPSE